MADWPVRGTQPWDDDLRAYVDEADEANAPATSASQTEAEAGTETNLRSWSPLRVKQAIAAWIAANLPSTAVGKALLNSADKPTARAAAGFTTGTPGTGEVQLVDAATLSKSKQFGISAPATIGSTLAVVNSTTETVIATWNIASGDLAAGDVLSMNGSLDVLNNSGVAASVTFRVRVGGVGGAAILASSAISHATTGNRYRWVWDLRALLVSLTDHRWSGFVHQAFASSTDLFNLGVNSALMPMALSTADMSGSTTLVVTAQLSAAAATLDCRGRGFALSRSRP